MNLWEFAFDHVHGVRASMEPLVMGCPTCIFYAKAERDHRASKEFHLEAWACLGCEEPIFAEVSPVGCALTGHTWQNELCLISWECACLAADVIREAVCEE